MLAFKMGDAPKCPKSSKLHFFARAYFDVINHVGTRSQALQCCHAQLLGVKAIDFPTEYGRDKVEASPSMSS